MQDRYVGDLGDFGKYGLLRALCAPTCPDGRPIPPALRLGVAWYLFKEESKAADGKHIGYLDPCLCGPSPRNRELFRACDPPLYDALRKIVVDQQRCVAAVQEGGVLPAGTVFHDTPLGFEDISGPGRRRREMRECRRRQWVDEMLKCTEGGDIVFADPDNGLRIKSRGPLAKSGPKHVYYEDLKQIVSRDQSLVVYHHAGRSGTVEKQVKDRLDEIRKVLGRKAEALVYRRGTVRVFFVIAAEHHREILKARVSGFLRTPWGTPRCAGRKPHFERCP